jgi:phosphoglycolate phosphatase-like HAD superfamily hydrolase
MLTGRTSRAIRRPRTSDGHNRYVRQLAESDTSHWQLAPHAAEAVSAVERRALLTGNPMAVAHARMERLGLGALFPPGQGAFGCERESRTALFELARQRAGNWPAGRTVAVGDTPLDVSSARDAGCLCVGVATGTYDEAELSRRCGDRPSRRARRRARNACALTLRA